MEYCKHWKLAPEALALSNALDVQLQYLIALYLFCDFPSSATSLSYVTAFLLLNIYEEVEDILASKVVEGIFWSIGEIAGKLEEKECGDRDCNSLG